MDISDLGQVRGREVVPSHQEGGGGAVGEGGAGVTEPRLGEEG